MTVTATDVTDGSKTPSTSAPIPVTNTAPTVVDDAYTMRQDDTLDVPADGVLDNDTDPEGQAIVVAAPRPASGPSHGTLTLHADGSFTYTPDAGYNGTDSFTYTATDGDLTSVAATVTIRSTTAAYVSSSDWSTSFDSARYLDLTFPAYVAPGSDVTGATFHHAYRSDTTGDTTCYYFQVFSGATLLATHGSAASPVSCNCRHGVRDGRHPAARRSTPTPRPTTSRCDCSSGTPAAASRHTCSRPSASTPPTTEHGRRATDESGTKQDPS